MMSHELRESFLEFFKSRGHAVVPGASLVPDNDPTLLFTNAGMNQFKDVFLGTGQRPYKRAADTQKCMRVSGKHNDLEDVGKDSYHHTLFEMLGNWSFGDYYKKEAISWAWELLTKVWKLPQDKLYATVHHTDDEAAQIWASETDIGKDRILKFGDKDNFWEMGATGPCGPCSEIHIDRGENACDKKNDKAHRCGVNAGCARYIELWNLVFIQYNRGEDGSLSPLPSRHVDTGMGFERILSVVQGKHSNYDTDLFTPIIARIEELSGKNYATNGVPMRVIADHIRSLAFSMADGVMPSNEGRGYVIRKILRRAIRYGKYLGFDGPFLNKIVDTVVSVMGGAFPELTGRRDMVKNLILSEEESFFKTLNRGIEKLNALVDEAKAKKTMAISGDDMFMLYDSLGLPVDFIKYTAEDEKIALDVKRFEELMEAQKERARASWKGASFDYALIADKVRPTEYTGEDTYESEEPVALLVKNGAIASDANPNDDVIVITARTPFYAEKGGQAGDIGVLEKGEARLAVTNTRAVEDVTLHYGRVVSGTFKTGDRVLMRVDRERKTATARNHTATHLIHKALKAVVGPHAAQAGSLVGPDRLRFDFTHSHPLTRDQIEKIENEANRAVLANLPVRKTRMSKDEAVKSGAVAIFEEKYGDVVRVVEVEGFSKELCGGTHVDRSGDIGLIKIVTETSISAGTRRLEAVTGMNSLEAFRSYFNRVRELASQFAVDDEKVSERIAQLQDTLKTREREIADMKKSMARGGADELIKNRKTVNGTDVVIARVDMDADGMKSAVDAIRQKSKSSVIFLLSVAGGVVTIVAGVSDDLTAKIKAGNLAKETAKIVGGGGGGRPDFAQAGGKDPSKADEALKVALEMIQKALG